MSCDTQPSPSVTDASWGRLVSRAAGAIEVIAPESFHVAPPPACRGMGATRLLPRESV